MSCDCGCPHHEADALAYEISQDTARKAVLLLETETKKLVERLRESVAQSEEAVKQRDRIAGEYNTLNGQREEMYNRAVKMEKSLQRIQKDRIHAAGCPAVPFNSNPCRCHVAVAVNGLTYP